MTSARRRVDIAGRERYSLSVGRLTHASLLLLTVLMLVVPTVQLTSAVSHSFTHQVSAKTFGKTSFGSRMPAVVTAPLALDGDAGAARVTPVEHHDLGPGFPSTPFVPPRG